MYPIARLKAAYRWLLFHLLRRKVCYGEYENPDGVGYLGWYELSRGTVLAFVRLDGSLLFCW